MNSVTGSKTGRSGYTLASVAGTPRIDWQHEGAGHQTLSPKAFVTLNIAPVNCSWKRAGRNEAFFPVAVVFAMWTCRSNTLAPGPLTKSECQVLSYTPSYKVLNVKCSALPWVYKVLNVKCSALPWVIRFWCLFLFRMLPPEARTCINRFQSLCDNEKRGWGWRGILFSQLCALFAPPNFIRPLFIPNPLRPQKCAGMADAVSRVGSTRKTASSMPTHFLVSTWNCVILGNALFGLHGKLRHPCQRTFWSPRGT